jgi:hypothetical protein
MRTALRKVSFAVVAIALLSTARAQSTQLVKDWEVALPSYKPGSGRSVCADNRDNVHVITSRGSWSTFDPSGKLIYQTEEPVLQGANGVLCLPSEGRVVVAVPLTDKLYTFSGDHKLLSSLTVSDGFRTIVNVGDGMIRLFAPHQGYLFRGIDPKTGATISSLAQGAVTSGDVYADEKRGLLLFVTHNPEILSAFDITSGSSMFLKPIVGDVREQPAGQSLNIPGSPTVHDRASGIFRISDNRYLVNINRTDVAPDRKLATTDLFYQILDAQFNVVGHLASDEIGIIIGSNGHGGVYGINHSDTFTLVKAHLQ